MLAAAFVLACVSSAAAAPAVNGTFLVPGVETNNKIVAGPDGKMWVATSEEVLRFSPSTPMIQEPKIIAELSPRDIDVAGSLVVVADAGKPRIVTLTTALGFGEKDLPIAIVGASQGVAGSPAGQIAFSDPGAVPEQIGLITPPNPAQTSEQLGDPFGVALGADQAFWFAQFVQGGVTRLTSAGQKTLLTGLPKESPRQIAAGPGNTLWVTLVKAGEEGVARISGLEPPLPPPPPV
ncbi:MAG TPA: hypothetical protein VHM66_07940, partial [Solirubrobacterales bacterium]|nr:hypothetical protein [Solirubrobacterales bacterium]